jgi:hypothetical protein
MILELQHGGAGEEAALFIYTASIFALPSLFISCNSHSPIKIT